MNNELSTLETQVVPANSVQLGAVRADSPVCVVDVATQIANKLRDVMESKKLFADIHGKEFPTCEAWTTCAAMLGISPRERSVILNEDGDYDAYVELIDGAGNIVGGASALCGSDEPTWSKRPRYARRSMAVTRATGKACRLKFSWIMTLAGYQPCSAEEMQGVDEATITQREERRETQARKVAPRAASTAHAANEDTGEVAFEGNWSDVVVHFGKNKGIRLGDMEPQQLRWYQNDWSPRPFRGKISEQDSALRAALDASLGKAPTPPDEELETVPF